MCIVPAIYTPSLANTGTCPLVPSGLGWLQGEQVGGVPVAGGTSVLLARRGPGQPNRAVFFISSNQGLRARWFTQRGRTMAIKYCWDQTAVASPEWCCLLAQVTALAGAPPIPQAAGTCLLAHPQHPVGTWEFSIRWWAAGAIPPPDKPTARTAAFRTANAHQIAVDGLLPSWLNANPARLFHRLAMIGPCGCP